MIRTIRRIRLDLSYLRIWKRDLPRERYLDHRKYLLDEYCNDFIPITMIKKFLEFMRRFSTNIAAMLGLAAIFQTRESRTPTPYAEAMKLHERALRMGNTFGGANPIYHPRKHTKQSYIAQRKAAKKRRRQY